MVETVGGLLTSYVNIKEEIKYDVEALVNYGEQFYEMVGAKMSPNSSASMSR